MPPHRLRYRQQSAFLDYGPDAMHPLQCCAKMAEEVAMHESTISRVTTRKYIHTPRGTFELKYFFSSGVSTEDGGSASATFPIHCHVAQA